MTLDFSQHFDAKRRERPARGIAQFRRKRRQDGVARLHQDDSRLGGIDGSKFIAQCLAGDLRERAGELYSGRSASNQDERQQLSSTRRIGLAFGALERKQDATPNLKGILERLQSRSIPVPLIVTKIAVARARRDDEIVVVDQRGVFQTNLSARKVYRIRLGEQHPDIPRVPEDPSDR